MNHRNGWASPNQLKPLREKTGVSGGRTPAPGRPGLRATAVALACPAGFGTSRRPVTRTGSLKHPPRPRRIVRPAVPICWRTLPTAHFVPSSL